MAVFRRLPGPLRRGVVHTATPCYTVGAVVVLRRDDNRIALVEQRHSPGWALPGGLVKRGESPTSGLVREVAEELGVTLDAGALPVPYAAVNALVRRVDVVFCVDAPPGVQLQSEDDVEVTGVGWFPLDALPEISEPTQEILRAVRLL
ncbi:MAG: 8-oxo-dGTP diphosphatase [Frankiaceae bacterium]|jgi:ADP-ribose pyrophosphatase YjhB (NUDIX family)|nr:8-oxo-dGTP diphosphatase [Frankiaceae bacterium]